MRLAAKWRPDWTWEVGLEPEHPEPVRIGGEWVDVLRLGRGRPLVLMPGLAGGWKLLSPLAQRLARHFEVFSVGLRGDRDPWVGLHGGPGVPWDLGEYAHDVKDLIDRMGLSSPAVMGVSFGGAIALEFAVKYPESLECPDRPWGRVPVPDDAWRRRSRVGSWSGIRCRTTARS